MRIEIVAVGKVRDRAMRELIDEYAQRLGRYLDFEEVEVREVRRGSDTARAMREEAESMESSAGESSLRIAMDERGKAWDSEELAQFIQDQFDQGKRCLSFFIGNANGLDPDFRRRCDRRLRLSSMTLPHDLARLVLAEQLYRAMTINRGEPYHR